ncbi:hypothetical protein [Desulfosporosinus sp. BG]|uniref:hypothetical protein n=1 Tax=Desulfosporosinus sp. BG TaxID=1633135 RepID=UPI00159F1CFD|nr:hypothetical protein [Desulfosporosinus sp. BG]
MSADDKALRNATVNIQNSPEVLRFSLSDKRIANVTCANVLRHFLPTVVPSSSNQA